MPPTQATAVGVNPQIIDDPRLRSLLQKLNEFEVPLDQQKDNNDAPVDVAALISTLEPYQSWDFEEQVCDWNCAVWILRPTPAATYPADVFALATRWIYTSGLALSMLLTRV